MRNGLYGFDHSALVACTGCAEVMILLNNKHKMSKAAPRGTFRIGISNENKKPEINGNFYAGGNYGSCLFGE
jgi:hypothetical protein